MARVSSTASFSDAESFRSTLQVIDVDIIEPASPLLAAEPQPLRSQGKQEQPIFLSKSSLSLPASPFLGGSPTRPRSMNPRDRSPRTVPRRAKTRPADEFAPSLVVAPVLQGGRCEPWAANQCASAQQPGRGGPSTLQTRTQQLAWLNSRLESTTPRLLRRCALVGSPWLAAPTLEHRCHSEGGSKLVRWPRLGAARYRSR